MLRSRFLLIITTLGLVFDYAFSQLNVGDRDSNICSSSAIGKQNIACAAKKCLEDLAACQNGVSFSRLECNGEKPKTPEIEPVSVSCNSTISRGKAKTQKYENLVGFIFLTNSDFTSTLVSEAYYRIRQIPSFEFEPEQFPIKKIAYFTTDGYAQG